MTTPATRTKVFEPGTTGWRAADLNDPEIDRLWNQGAYEIVEGVLTVMPPAYHDGTRPLAKLRRLVERHLDRQRIEGEFTHEDDFVVGGRRVARVDMMFMSPEDERRQEEANAEGGRLPHLRFGRILVPPTLIVESISLGHQDHDRDTKRQWYADAKVPHYWILDAYERTLECLVLREGRFDVDQAGRNADELRPALFPGLVVPLADLWK
jgi:Uma2 family endonuclease